MRHERSDVSHRCASFAHEKWGSWPAPVLLNYLCTKRWAFSVFQILLEDSACYYLVTGTLYIIKTWLHSEHIRTFLVFRVIKHLQWLPQPLLSKTGWRQKKLTTIRFAQYISTVQRKPKGNHKLTLSLVPAWEIAISPVHTEAFRNFSASAVGIASLSSWLVANRFSISDITGPVRNAYQLVFFGCCPL